MNCVITLKQINKNSTYKNIYNSILNANNIAELHDIIKNTVDNNLLDASGIQEILQVCLETTNKNDDFGQIMIIENAIQNLSQFLTSFKGQVVSEDIAKFRYDRTDQLIPLLNIELNREIETRLHNKAFSLCYYNSNSGIVNPSEIWSALGTYKNELFELLSNYTGIYTDTLLDLSSLDISDLTAYNTVMKEAWKRLKMDSVQRNTSFVKDPVTQKMLSVYEAFYVLNNFDSFVTWASNKTINVNPKYEGDTSVKEDKYKLIDQKKANTTFEGSHSDQDAAKQESKIFKQFWYTISDGKGGYCTDSDLRVLCNLVDVALNSSDTTLDFLLDPTVTDEEFLEKLNDPYVQKIFQNALKNKNMLDNIIKELTTFYQHYKNTIDNKSDIELESIQQVQDIAHKLNFVAQFRNELKSHNNKTYIGVDENGETLVKSQVAVRKSKQSITNKIQTKLIDNLKHKRSNLYRASFNVNPTATNVYSQKFLDFLNDAFGLHLSSDQLNSLFSNEEFQTDLWDFVDNFFYNVNEKLMPDISTGVEVEVAVAKFIDNLKRTESFIRFTNNLVEDNLNNSVKLLDQNGNNQPVSANPNTVQSVKKNILQFKKEHPTNRTNLFANYPVLISPTTNLTDKFISHVGYRQDIAYLDQRGAKQVIRAVELSPLDSLLVAFNNEFFDSIINNNTFWNQIEAYSDKVTIALAGMNMLAEAAWDGKTSKQFGQLKSTELQQLWWNQLRTYYHEMYNQVMDDLIKVITYDGKVVDNTSVITVLESYKAKDFQRAVNNYNKDHQDAPVEITQEIHYCSEKGNCRFNNALYYYFENTVNPELTPDNPLLQYYIGGQKQLAEQLKKIRIPRKYRNAAYIEEHLQELSELFDLDGSVEERQTQLEDFFATNKKEDITWNRELDKLSENAKLLTDNIINKYFWLQAISTEAEQQMSAKDFIIHKGKKDPQLTISDLNTKPASVKQSLLNNSISKRLSAQKKRNNFWVSSYLPMDVTSKYGVGTHSRVAMVSSNTQPLMNINGQVNNAQDVVDGSIQTLGIATVWEGNSYGSKHVEATKKIIGFIPTRFGAIQIKCADYTLDNIRIANSFRQAGNTTEDAYERARKMMITGKFSDSFYNAYRNSNGLSNGTEIRKFIGTDVYALTSIRCDLDHNMTFTWESESTGEILTETREVNNVYDLWVGLGEYNTIENQEGNWVTSNASMEYIAKAISEYDPDVKNKITSKIVDVSACKSGITNINLMEDVDNPNNDWIDGLQIDNTRLGLQQDYAHDSDESTIPLTTQVVSSLAFNGKNIRLVKNVNNALAALTLRNAQAAGITYNGTPEQQLRFYQKLVDSLIYSLKDNSGVSDAITLTRKAADTIKEMLQNGDVDLSAVQYKDANLPYSSPDIFYKLASDIITILNSKSIRQKMAGIAIVQNPSHGQICVFEDNTGNVWKREDIIKLARERVRQGQIPADVLQGQDIVQNYIQYDPRFAKQLIEISNGANDFELEDTYEIVNATTGEIIERKRIEHPKDLFVLDDKIRNNPDIKVYKLFGQQRNLKVPNITWTENGVKKSLWLSNSTKARIKFEDFATSKNGATVASAQENLLWYRSNLDGLSQDVPYYYNTYDDYRNNVKTYVQNVSYTPGEQIIPKVNKTAQGLDAKSLREIDDRGIMYFISTIRSKFDQKSGNQLTATVENGEQVILTRDADNNAILNDDTRGILTVVRDSDEIVYTFTKPSINAVKLENPTLKEVQEDGKTIYYFQNENFQNLFAVPKKEGTEIYSAQYGGKTIYYVSNASQDESLFTALDYTDGINAVYSEAVNEETKRNLVKKTSKYNDEFNPNAKDINLQYQKMAQKLYDSFKLSNYTVSVRIPSQSFQSFMANKTIAFMNDQQNNGYINIYEIWFTGGDYDIKFYWCH